jgi:predicted neuraminidase
MVWFAAGAVTAQTPQPGVLKTEFLFERAPFPSCHASTICEVDGALLAAWFGGTREGALDVVIWFSRNDGNGWTEPVELANGRNDEDRIYHPCWNPVLFQPKNGPLLLFYKVGPSPSTWWGMVKSSSDGGRSWTDGKRLPKDIYGPIRNKPIELDDGTLLCGSSTEDSGWRVHVERSKTGGRFWSRTPPLNRAVDYGAIQPTLLKWKDGRLQMLCRTKQEKIVDSWSSDLGQTWSRFISAGLPNPNSGIDAVMLRDDRALLVYNHATSGRGVLNVAMTRDGRRWQAAVVLENEPGGEFSYPAVIQSRDGYVHVTYTWRRERIKHVVLDPDKFDLHEIVDGQWR